MKPLIVIPPFKLHHGRDYDLFIKKNTPISLGTFRNLSDEYSKILLGRWYPLYLNQNKTNFKTFIFPFRKLKAYNLFCKVF